uniref:Uncharacterized protein n=1 Tax=Arundo donax TaxID=35708 RepID=A0A0A9FS37_ARUDO
MLKNLFSCCE